MSVVQNKDINLIVFRRNNNKVLTLNIGDVKYFIKGLKRSYLMGIFYDPSKQFFVTTFLENYLLENNNELWKQNSDEYQCRLLLEKTFKQLSENDRQKWTKSFLDSAINEVESQLDLLRYYGKLHFCVQSGPVETPRRDQANPQDHAQPGPSLQ